METSPCHSISPLNTKWLLQTMSLRRLAPAQTSRRARTRRSRASTANGARPARMNAGRSGAPHSRPPKRSVAHMRCGCRSGNTTWASPRHRARLGASASSDKALKRAISSGIGSERLRDGCCTTQHKAGKRQQRAQSEAAAVHHRFPLIDARVPLRRRACYPLFVVTQRAVARASRSPTGSLASFRTSLPFMKRQLRSRQRYTFLTQIEHQPLGLIVPSTTVHELGGVNCRQLSQRWSAFGLS